jgi:hypothetical protein
MPRLDLKHVLQQTVEEAAARALAESALAPVDDLAQAHIEGLRRDKENQTTSYAAIASKLEEAPKKLLGNRRRSNHLKNTFRVSRNIREASRRDFGSSKCK